MRRNQCSRSVSQSRFLDAIANSQVACLSRPYIRPDAPNMSPYPKTPLLTRGRNGGNYYTILNVPPSPFMVVCHGKTKTRSRRVYRHTKRVSSGTAVAIKWRGLHRLRVRRNGSWPTIGQ